MARLIDFAERKPKHRAGAEKTKTVYFNRQELQKLLALYGTRVAVGEWRDYAIDHRPGCAVFSVFRHTHESPLFSIAKRLSLAKTGPGWEVYEGLRTIKRSKTLGGALSIFERHLTLVG